MASSSEADCDLGLRSTEDVHDVMVEARPGVKYGCWDCCDDTEVIVSDEQMDDVREDVLGAIVIANKGDKRRDIFRMYDLQLSQAADRLLPRVEACDTFRRVR